MNLGCADGLSAEPRAGGDGFEAGHPERAWQPRELAIGESDPLHPLKKRALARLPEVERLRNGVLVFRLPQMPCERKRGHHRCAAALAKERRLRRRRVAKDRHPPRGPAFQPHELEPVAAPVRRDAVEDPR